MTDAREFLRQALDPTRLAVLGGAAAGPVDAEALARGLGVPLRRVKHAIARLLGAGLLAEDLTLDRDALRAIAAELPRAAPPDAEVIEKGTWTDEEEEVLRRFFRGSRLAEIPGSRAKRLIVLERLAQEFEPGLRYEEAEVNFILQLRHPDYAALRRYLVDEGLLTRADGVYWRTGGRFDALDPTSDSGGR